MLAFSRFIPSRVSSLPGRTIFVAKLQRIEGKDKDGRGSSSFRDSKSSPGGPAVVSSSSLPLTVVRIILGADVPVGIV